MSSPSRTARRPRVSSTSFLPSQIVAADYSVGRRTAYLRPGSRPRPISRRLPARPVGVVALPVVSHVLVRIQRFLRRTPVHRDVLQVDANARPRLEPPAH